MAILSYGYNHLPTTDTRLNDLHIFGSSSKGNSIYFKDGRFLIDLGFPYKKYIEYDRNFFLKVDFIFLGGSLSPTASSVADLTAEPILLREGSVPRAELERVWGGSFRVK